MKKVLITTLVWLVALAVVVTPVSAYRGPLAVAVDETEIEVPNFNFGWVGNSVFAEANSGWNWTVGEGAEVDTGNAKITASVSTGMNSNTTRISYTDYEWGPFAVNLGGYETDAVEEQMNGGGYCHFPMPCWLRMALGYWMWTGEPVAVAWDNTEVEVKNFNMGIVTNNLTLLANTGHNFTFGNSPEVDTGNAAVTANVGTTLNTNTTTVALAESGVGPVAVNFEFGEAGLGCFGAGPLALAVESDEVEVSNKNFGLVGNDIFARANSDWNMTMGEGAEVETGNATVASNVSNAVNTNSTSVSKTDTAVGPVAANVDVGGLCGVDGVPCLPAGGVGPVAANVGTSGVAVAVETDEVEVSNKNDAVVSNQETLLANTGHNVTVGCPVEPCEPPCIKGDGGEEAGELKVTPTPEPVSVETGDAEVTTTVTNTVNTNSTTITVSEGAPLVP